MSSAGAPGARWLLPAVALALGLHTLPVAAEVPATRPNIVVILTDDEDVASHRVMAKTRALLEDQGTVLDNYFVTYSICCPSRVTILRGQYPHNTQIEGNEPPTGGFAKFRKRSASSDSTIATWLNAAGYRTAFLGKLMNGYEPERDGALPGWDEWYGGGGKFSNFNYTLNENGRIVAYGERPEDHLTDVLARKAAGHRARGGGRASRCSSTSRPMRPAQPGDLGAAPRRPVRGRAPAAAALVRRAGRQRQARHTSPTCRRSTRADRGAEPPQPRAAARAAGGRRPGRDRGRRARARPAGSTTPTSSTPRTTASTWASTGCSSARPRPTRRTSACRWPCAGRACRGRAGRRDGAEQRPGADLRRHRRGRAAEHSSTAARSCRCSGPRPGPGAGAS